MHRTFVASRPYVTVAWQKVQSRNYNLGQQAPIIGMEHSKNADWGRFKEQTSEVLAGKVAFRPCVASPKACLRFLPVPKVLPDDIWPHLLQGYQLSSCSRQLWQKWLFGRKTKIFTDKLLLFTFYCSDLFCCHFNVYIYCWICQRYLETQIAIKKIQWIACQMKKIKCAMWKWAASREPWK